MDRTVDRPLGIDVLRNHAETAVSIALTFEADFVQVEDVFQDCARETLRLREQLVDSKILVNRRQTRWCRAVDRQPTADPVERGLAEGVIVSGTATAEAVDTDTLEAAVAALGRPRTADSDLCQQWRYHRLRRPTAGHRRPSHRRYRAEGRRSNDKSGRRRPRRTTDEHRCRRHRLTDGVRVILQRVLLRIGCCGESPSRPVRRVWFS